VTQLIASMNLTADGCCDHRLVIADDELHSYANEVAARSGGLLFGRVTYELFEPYWPELAEPPTGKRCGA
jgi:hypothetical protein